MRRLPIVKIEEKHCKKENNEIECPVCPVCTDDLTIGKDAMFMPCGHAFDPDCLKPWLRDHNTCPVCRHELPVRR